MSIRYACLIGLTLAGLELPRQAAAQNVEPGARVRLVGSPRTRTLAVGTLIRLTADSVTILTEGPDSTRKEVVWVLGGVNRLQRSDGMHGRTLAGLGTGLVVGAGVGAIVGLATYRKPDCSQSFICLDFGPGLEMAGGALALGLSGMLIGSFIGSKHQHEVWKPITDRQVRVGLAPTPARGVRLTASMAF